MNYSHARFKDCSIEGLGDDHEIMVYSQDFIKDNFFEPEGLKGIFTLSKKNKDAEIKIGNAQSEIFRLGSELEKKEDCLKFEKEKIARKLTESQNIAWKIRTKYSGGDRVLEFCLDNLKGSKEKLFKYLAGIPKPTTEPTKDIRKLKNELESISGDNYQKYNKLPCIDFQLTYIETNSLFEKKIIGSNSSTVSNLITELGNSDWVKDGLEYISNKEGQENENCPFCQEKTISKLLLRNIESYFDKSYEDDKKSIINLLNIYRQTRQSILPKSIFEENPKYEAYKKEFEVSYEKVIKILDYNIKKIEDKIRSPSLPVSLISSIEALEDINRVV